MATCLSGTCPLVFFAAMTLAVPSSIASLPWFSRLKGGSTWVTHPRGKALLSRHFPEKVLHSTHSTDVPVAAPYYCRVVLDSAWCVPIILGRFPKNPTSDSTLEQKGRFALFMLLLFKPWRSLKKDIFACLSMQSGHSNTSPWQLLYADFER